MVSTVLTANVLVNGLRSEFTDTYTKVRNRVADSRIGQVMDMSINVDNRTKEFAYFEAGPHAEFWRRGDPIPTDAMGSVRFTATVHNWGRKVQWHRDDRMDDQTQSLMDAARMAGESFGLLPERMFFDLIQGTTTTLPAVPTAPDGGAMFATTVGGANRFGASSGNLLTGTGVSSVSTVQADYYSAIQQFMLFQDGKGQPLLSPETIAAGVIIMMAPANLRIFEQSFLQKLNQASSAATSNVVQDASRNVELFPAPRITGNSWYVFLKNPPKKSTFMVTRQDVVEQTSFQGDNNSDQVRTVLQESIQWDSRVGAGIALPYGAIKVS